MKTFDASLYVADMYKDPLFPDFLVDKVKAALAEVAAYLETGERDTDKVQAKFDEAMNKINVLQEEFEENDSEIETAARESIGQTVFDIIRHFDLDLDVETAMKLRDW